MMGFDRFAISLIAGGCALSAVTSGCSPLQANTSPEVESPTRWRTLAARLSVQTSSPVLQMSYRVQGGPVGVTRTGTLELQGSNGNFRIGDLAVGPGYTLYLTGETLAGDLCEGHSAFAMLDQTTTELSVAVRCGASATDRDTGGDVVVSVTLPEPETVECAEVASLAVQPSPSTPKAVEVVGTLVGVVEDSTWSTQGATLLRSGPTEATLGCSEERVPLVVTWTLITAGCPPRSMTFEAGAYCHRFASQETDAGAAWEAEAGAWGADGGLAWVDAAIMDFPSPSDAGELPDATTEAHDGADEEEALDAGASLGNEPMLDADVPSLSEPAGPSTEPDAGPMEPPSEPDVTPTEDAGTATGADAGAANGEEVVDVEAATTDETETGPDAGVESGLPGSAAGSRAESRRRNPPK